MKTQNKISSDIISKYRAMLMGLSIIVIILFHYIEDCRIYKTNYNELMMLFNKWIASGGVDVFAFLSGFGLYYSLKKNPDIKSFYTRRMIKILIPYLVVAIPAIIWRDIFIENNTFLYAIKDLSFFTFFSQGRMWFWYIGFSVLMYAIFPYIFKIVDTSPDEISGEIRLISIVSIITVFSLTIVDTVIFKRINIAILRIPFFVFGAFYGKSSYEKRNTSWKWIILSVIAVFIRYLDIKYPMNSIIVRRYSLGLVSLCTCFLVCVIFEYLKLIPLKKIFEWFGKYSLWLYILHVAIRDLLNKQGYYTYNFKYEMVVVVGSIVLSVLLSFIVEDLPKRIKRRKVA